jgi:hypothetical protein
VAAAGGTFVQVAAAKMPGTQVNNDTPNNMNITGMGLIGRHGSHDRGIREGSGANPE